MGDNTKRAWRICQSCEKKKRTTAPDPYTCKDCQTGGAEPKTPIRRKCADCGKAIRRPKGETFPLCQECGKKRETQLKVHKDKVTPPPKKRGRPTGSKTGTSSAKDRGIRNRESSNLSNRRSSQVVRDIVDQWDDRVQGIDWGRRLKSWKDLRFTCETYLPAVFYLGWSDDQLTAIRKASQVIEEDGMFALAMPRGGGKTAICRAATIWGTAHGWKSFPFIVGSSAPKATQTLEFIRTYWFRSLELRQDFPEIAYPVERLENRYHLARGQTFNGHPTFIEWGSESLTYPSLILDAYQRDRWIKSARNHSKAAALYAESFLQEVRDPDSGEPAWITRNSGTIVRSAGIDGSIRGDADIHPVTLEQPRPDVVLLDDIQKDQKAESLVACEKLVRLIDGAVAGLAGPGRQISVLMPCTVTREGDVSDTYLDQDKKPDYKGERKRMVISWPEGITDFEITMDSEEGQLWNEYAQLRVTSLRLHEDTRLAKEFYIKNREKMDEGFEVSWPDRYNPDTEVSAQQHVMEIRLKIPATFPAEYQNIGRREDGGLAILISQKQLQEKQAESGRWEAPGDAHYVSAFIDVQNEILFWGVFATAPNFTGAFCSYGTWPEVPAPIFTKAQTESWSLLTRAFFERYPEHRDKAIKTSSGKIRAPLEAKVYNALSMAVPYLLDHPLIRKDAHDTPIKIQKLGIDSRWGQVTDTIKRYVRECGRREVIPCLGEYLPPTHRQFEEFSRENGWLFEDQINPQVKEVKWVLKPDSMGQFQLRVDAARMKDFLMSRLGSPAGSVGSVSVHRTPDPSDHALFAQHITKSEYPEPLTARGITKNLWKERQSGGDNDFLDVAYNCLALASLLGAFLPTEGGQKPKAKAFQERTQRARFSELRKQKRGA